MSLTYELLTYIRELSWSVIAVYYLSSVHAHRRFHESTAFFYFWTLLFGWFSQRGNANINSAISYHQLNNRPCLTRWKSQFYIAILFVVVGRRGLWFVGIDATPFSRWIRCRYCCRIQPTVWTTFGLWWPARWVLRNSWQFQTHYAGTCRRRDQVMTLFSFVFINDLTMHQVITDNR